MVYLGVMKLSCALSGELKDIAKIFECAVMSRFHLITGG